MSRNTRAAFLGFAFACFFTSLPLFAARKPDTGSSQNGSFQGCNNGNTCVILNAKGTAILSGTDKLQNPVTVTINLYDWGCTTCSPQINAAVLDVVLNVTDPSGTDTVDLQSLVVKGSLPSPRYVSCDASGGIAAGIGCTIPPAGGSLAQQPTPIQGADSGSNTRWDFGGVAPVTIPFHTLLCEYDGYSPICNGSPTPTGEAILLVNNSVSLNKLGTSSSQYLATLTDGTVLGTLTIVAPPHKQVLNTNNTQGTAKVITTATFTDYIDASQAYPQMNTDGSEQYPGTFTPLPIKNPPACNPVNDDRTFRTAWYTYTAPSNGIITISTAGSRYDTLVYVFTGDASAPNVISCDDDPASDGSLVQAVATFKATQNVQYEIMVGETPTIQTPGIYPLSVESFLSFNFAFTTGPWVTATKVTSSPNPSNFGVPVTFTATVTSQSKGVIAGNVTFTEGSTTLGTAALNGGVASISAVPLGVGAVITATYGGNSYFAPSSGSINQTVNQGTTKLTLTSSPNPSGLGQSVKFTASITPVYSVPATGTITFNNSNGTTLGTVTVSGDMASVSTATLGYGNNSITAVYSGDVNFKGSTSNILRQNVENASSTKLTSSINPATIGNPVTFTVNVTSPQGTPKGTVQVLIGTTQLAILTLTSGSATYSTSDLPAGSDTITAVYSGNSSFIGSTSSPLNQSVIFPPKYSVLYSFAGLPNAYVPQYGLVLDSDGNMYGTTSGDGTYGYGTVVKVSPAGQVTILHSFGFQDGNYPGGGLVFDSQGYLYGTTAAGGTYGQGTVFRLSTLGEETILYSFSGGTDGINPFGGLVIDSKGNLYGTTNLGGTYGEGTVFEIAATTFKETVLYSFGASAVDASYPIAGLVLDKNNNLYGTTNGGGTNGSGTVFEIPAGGGQDTVLYNFCSLSNCNDGNSPNDGLVIDGNGNLYGTTQYGGTGAGGTVFEVIAATHQETVLYNFCSVGGYNCTDGYNPVAGLVMDTKGNLYGTNSYGGTNGLGDVFEVSSKTQSETVLYSFGTNGGDGISPVARLALDTLGNLYGTTGAYSSYYPQSVFKLTPALQEIVLYHCCSGGTDGVNPSASLILDSKGTLYGTTAYGGSGRNGTVFKVTTAGAETFLYSFCPSGATSCTTDGVSPTAGLVMDTKGNLYGATQTGGTYGNGTVYEISAAGQETLLYSFCPGGGACTDGSYPYATLTIDSQGNLFGTSKFGGAYGFGTVFEITAAGQESVLYSFCPAGFPCVDGELPSTGLVMDAAGNLYGTTPNGGAYQWGTVYEIAATSHQQTVLYNFGATVSDGLTPSASLVLDKSGNLYGTTINGGAHGAGTVFEISKGKETLLWNFGTSSTDGSAPQAALVLDSSGNMYGTTIFGGTFGQGTVFKVTPAGQESVLYNFTGLGGDGAQPYSGLVMDSSGNLYGTTFKGGSFNGGSIFKLTP